MHWFLAVIALLLILLLAAFRSAARERRLLQRVQRRVAATPAAVWREVFTSIDRAGADDGTPLVMLRPADDRQASWIGGSPDLPADLPWPTTRSGAPAKFVLQVLLQSPPLPENWAGRRVFVFRDESWRIIVCSSRAPARLPRRATMPADHDPHLYLAPVRLPHGAEPCDATTLCQTIPRLEQLLAGRGEEPALLLACALDAMLLIGGAPEWWVPESGRCPDCGQHMRFLFRDEAGISGLEEPYLCVFGCDDHPHRLDGVLAKMG